MGDRPVDPCPTCGRTSAEDVDDARDAWAMETYREIGRLRQENEKLRAALLRAERRLAVATRPQGWGQ